MVTAEPLAAPVVMIMMTDEGRPPARLARTSHESLLACTRRLWHFRHFEVWCHEQTKRKPKAKDQADQELEGV